MKLSYVLKYPKSRSVQRLVRRFGSYQRLCIVCMAFKPSSRYLIHDLSVKYEYIMRLLLVRGCSVDITDYIKGTTLHYASSDGIVGVVRLLLSVGANANHEDRNNNIALHWACSDGHSDIVRTLLTVTAVDVQNVEGETPLHIAAYYGYADVVSILLAAGAHIDARNWRNRNAAWMARLNDRSDVVKQLRDAMN